MDRPGAQSMWLKYVTEAISPNCPNMDAATQKYMHNSFLAGFVSALKLMEESALASGKRLHELSEEVCRHAEEEIAKIMAKARDVLRN